MTLPLRSVSSNKNLSPTAKLKNKLNFKKNSKSSLLNGESPKKIEKLSDKMNEKLIDKLNDKLTDRLTERLSEKLSCRLNDKMIHLTDKITDNLNNNIINNKTSFAYTSLNAITDWNKFKYDDNNKIVLNHTNCFNDYDRIPAPVLAKRI